MKNLSISGTVSFKNDSSNRWQTVYSSSLYGTMFSLFGKFDYDETKLTLNKVLFRIVNYKGLIDLGIVSVEFQPERKLVLINDYNPSEEDPCEDTDLPVPKTVRVISVKIQIQALEGYNCKKTDNTYVLKQDDLQLPVYLEIDRELLPLVSNKDRAGSVYDTEHYYRDGLRDSYQFTGKHLNFRRATGLNPTMKKWKDKAGNEIFIHMKPLGKDLYQKEDGKLINDKGELVDLLSRRVDKDGMLVDEKGNQIIENGKPKKGKFDSADKSPGAVCPKGYSKIVF